MLITPNPTVELLAARLKPRGFKVKSFELDNTAYTQFTAPNGKIWLTPSANIHYPFVTTASRQICFNKAQSYEFVKKAGLTTPHTMQVTSHEVSAKELDAMLKFAPLIVKPNTGSLSNGLSRNVNTAGALKRAIKAAFAFSTSVLVQEQVSGEELRFVVIENKVTAVMLRQKPRVVGDGKSTLGELIERENQERAMLKLPYATYPILDENIIDFDKLDLSAIPAKDEPVELGPGTMIKHGASIYNVMSTTHQSYIKKVEDLAAKLGEGFLVVDMFVMDYRQPLKADNYTFIEFNSAPVLKLFYSCRDGHQYDVLEELVPLIERALDVPVVGSFEAIDLPDFGVKNVLAKIDTGAYSGAIHCNKIKLTKDKTTGEKVLEFSLFDDPKTVYRSTNFSYRRVRSSSGHQKGRYIVDSTVKIRGQVYAVKIGLADRSEMAYPALVGRRFLRRHGLLVDVRQNQAYDKDMELDT